MKLQRKDKVLITSGRDKGKTGSISVVLPKTNQVVIDGINVVKRHTKPSQANPKGGILEVTKPISASKVMAIDPASGRPARIGYKVGKDGKKERVFKVSTFKNTKQASKTPAKKTAKPAIKGSKS
jgi:large subunit ribosomal protein L24